MKLFKPGFEEKQHGHGAGIPVLKHFGSNLIFPSLYREARFLNILERLHGKLLSLMFDGCYLMQSRRMT